MNTLLRSIALPCLVATSMVLPGCGDSTDTAKKSQEKQPKTTTTTKKESPPAAALRKGTFQGDSGHTLNGTVTIHKTASGLQVRLGKDFSFDGAPDPWLGFGKGGEYDKTTQFSKLQKNAGEQVYNVPANVDIAKYDQIYVWCSRFSQSMGKANLN